MEIVITNIIKYEDQFYEHEFLIKAIYSMYDLIGKIDNIDKLYNSIYVLLKIMFKNKVSIDLQFLEKIRDTAEITIISTNQNYNVIEVYVYLLDKYNIQLKNYVISITMIHILLQNPSHFQNAKIIFLLENFPYYFKEDFDAIMNEEIYNSILSNCDNWEGKYKTKLSQFIIMIITEFKEKEQSLVIEKLLVAKLISIVKDCLESDSLFVNDLLNVFEWYGLEAPQYIDEEDIKEIAQFYEDDNERMNNILILFNQ